MPLVPATFSAPAVPHFDSHNAGLTALPILLDNQWIPTSVVFDGPAKDPSSMGISTFGQSGIQLSAPGPVNRLYLVNPEGSAHQQIYLNNRVLTFTTDISQVKCGYNAAFYFSNMNPSAPLGTQYCDGQGTCNEFDVLEANIAAINQATHGCQGAKDNCDHWGCSINSRTLAGAIAPSPKSVIDLGKPFTVSTTFRTADGTDNGVLVAIEQVYSQGSKSFSLPTINDNYCLALGAADPQYPTTGKLLGLSDAFRSGMTMVFSLWGDGTDSMKWLDNGLSNPNCKAAANGNNSAKFSNIQVSRISKK